jgi:hypothetical protein
LTLRANFARAVREVRRDAEASAVPPPVGDEIAVIQRVQLLAAGRRLPVAAVGNVVVGGCVAMVLSTL